jgi:hypothetical protein
MFTNNHLSCFKHKKQNAVLDILYAPKTDIIRWAIHF